jgi:hypothetical protein
MLNFAAMEIPNISVIPAKAERLIPQRQSVLAGIGAADQDAALIIDVNCLTAAMG